MEWAAHRAQNASFFFAHAGEMTAFGADATEYMRSARRRLATAVRNHERRMAGVHTRKTIAASAALKQSAYGAVEALERRLSGGATFREYDATVDACVEADEAVKRFKRRCRFMYDVTK